MKYNRLLNLFYALLGAVLFSTCSGNDSMMEQKARLEVRLTDDPAAYDAVYIDVQDIQINVTDDVNGGWQSLPGVRGGVYNLLNLVNDKDTLLVNADIPGGRLHQLRLVLGSNNALVVNGVTVPLETPSAQQSGLKLNIQQDVKNGILYTLLLDFDAGRSIVKTGNGRFILKPVIRTVVKAVGGSIKGYVQPPLVTTGIWAIQGTDTVAGTFTGNGGYLIKGLGTGTYALYYRPLDTLYLPQTRTGIAVMVNQVTLVDTVLLQKK